ncbi:MAG: hypothetical protein WD712_02935 [Candidatus Spechtbacterales bacterium]
MNDLSSKALKLLHENTQTAEYKGKIYKFSVPSKEIYPFQWLWDSCFHAISFSVLGENERAKEELRSLLAKQADDGAIYHITFWKTDKLKDYLFLSTRGFGRFLENRGFWLPLNFLNSPKTTAYTQPPVLAKAAEKIYENSKDKDFVREILPALFKYYRWLYKTRDLDGDNLISILTPIESGLDFCPAYDEAIGYKNKFLPLFLRSRWLQFLNKFIFNFDPYKIYKNGPFHQKDVLFNSIAIQALFSLAYLAEEIGNKEIYDWAHDKAQAGLRSLCEKSYDKETGLFYNLSGKEDKAMKIKTIVSLMPLIISQLPANIARRLVQEHIINQKEFYTPYPVASVSWDEAVFAPDSLVDGHLRIWRGPLSMNTNWFLVHALREHGYADTADEITKKSRELAEKHGFWEFYNPLTGEPQGARDFGWATLVVDM